MNKLDKNERYYLHCLGGYRSTIMASILRARGFENLVDIIEGWRAIEESDVPKSDYACPTTIPQETIDAAIALVA